MGRIVAQTLGKFVLVMGLATMASAQWYLHDGKTLEGVDFAKYKGGFGAQLWLTNDLEGFIESWARPKDPVQMKVSNRAERGKPIDAVVLFSNCKAGPDGFCDATVDFRVLRPDGSTYGRFENTELWLKKPPPVKDAIQPGIQTLGVKIEPEDPDGEYRVEATVRDNVRGVTHHLVQSFWVGTQPGPRTGASSPRPLYLTECLLIGPKENAA